MAPNELLRNLAALLGRNPGTTLYPSLSAIQLSIADHLTDDETAQLPPEMLHQKPIDLRHKCLFYIGHIPT